VSPNEAHSHHDLASPDSTGVFRVRRARIAVIDDDQCIVSVVRRTLAGELAEHSEMIVHKPFTPHSLRAWVKSTLQRLAR
jgi:hypothetical protein